MARSTEVQTRATKTEPPPPGWRLGTFGLSRRQAYRYLQEAQEIGHSEPVVEPSVPITLKMPGNIVRDLRAYSVTSGLTLGEIVTRAVTAFLATVRRHRRSKPSRHHVHLA